MFTMHWTKFFSCLYFCVIFMPIEGSLWDELQRINDLSQWRQIVSEHNIVKFYVNDEQAQQTDFAPVDDVFNRHRDLLGMRDKELLAHIVDVRVPEIAYNRPWANGSLLIKNSVANGAIYILQVENNPGNFSYFANNGRVCNHVSTSWMIASGDQYMYKICSWFGHQPFQGSALDFVKADPTQFQYYRYNNLDLVRLRDQLQYFPTEATIVFGTSAWNSRHTFFLPNNQAFERIDRNLMNREVLLAHVTFPNCVLFMESWLYDYGIHEYNSLRIDANTLMDNYKLKLSVRNITDRDTGQWELWVMSNVYERYSTFRRGAVWAKIITPNIPVQNGVVHIIDTVLGIVTNNMEQILFQDHRFIQLKNAVSQIGQLIRGFLITNQGLMTFFAPTNEAFMRIPQDVRDRLFRDKYWLLRVLRMHIVPGTELTSDQINNQTIANTQDENQRLFFVRGEWPKNNITYYVIGGGVRASIRQEDIAAMNGIMHYVDRVLGVPYETMYEILRNETTLQISYQGVDNTNLKYMLDPWKVIRPEQNFTFFVPTDDAWQKVPLNLRRQFFDGNHWLALQFVFKRHVLQGQALMVSDFRPRTYVMMNNQRIEIKRQGRFWQIYWPYGNIVANIMEFGGEICAINGYMHKIDNVLLLEEDLKAGASRIVSDTVLVLLGLLFLRFLR